MAEPRVATSFQRFETPHVHPALSPGFRTFGGRGKAHAFTPTSTHWQVSHCYHMAKTAHPTGDLERVISLPSCPSPRPDLILQRPPRDHNLVNSLRPRTVYPWRLI